jgi:hypothetical protein
MEEFVSRVNQGDLIDRATVKRRMEMVCPGSEPALYAGKD